MGLGESKQQYPWCALLSQSFCFVFAADLLHFARLQLNPCSQELLDAYVQCMDENEGRRPEPYEPEYCEVEKNAYRACRAALKERKSKSEEPLPEQQQQ